MELSCKPKYLVSVTRLVKLGKVLELMNISLTVNKDDFHFPNNVFLIDRENKTIKAISRQKHFSACLKYVLMMLFEKKDG